MFEPNPSANPDHLFRIQCAKIEQAASRNKQRALYYLSLLKLAFVFAVLFAAAYITYFLKFII